MSSGCDALRPLLEVRRVSKEYFAHGRRLSALREVSLQIEPGEVLGLVGESGSGKTTLARILMQLEEPSSGEVLYKGQLLGSLSSKERRRWRREVGIVFQDPYASLDPRMTVLEIVAEGLEIHGLAKGEEKIARVRKLLRLVGLEESHLARYPHEFSGGQRQRIAIARALAPSPSLVILDEPISSLDVSVQAQVVTLLQRLQRELRIAYLFIAHDLSMVRYLSNRVAVLYRGDLVESGLTDEVYEYPSHPYTKGLLSAALLPDPRRAVETLRSYR